MQFTLSINQKALVELNKALGLDLNLKHGSIIDFFIKVKNNTEFQTKIIKGEEYIWLSYNKIIEELPLLKIKSKIVLARYFEDLVKANVLKKQVLKEEGNKTFWRQDVNLQCLVFDKEVSTKKFKGINSKVERVSTKKFSNHITNDQNTNQEKDPSIFFEKIKQITNKLNLEGTPHQNEIITEIIERTPKDKIEGYLEYLDQQINEKKEKYLKTAFQPVAFYNWYYKDYLGVLNVELEKEKEKETEYQQNLEIIDSSKLSKGELERQIRVYKDAKINYKII